MSARVATLNPEQIARKRMLDAACAARMRVLHPRTAEGRHAEYLKTDRGFRRAAAKSIMSLLRGAPGRRRRAALNDNPWLQGATDSLRSLLTLEHARRAQWRFHAASPEARSVYMQNYRRKHGERRGRPISVREWLARIQEFNGACAYCLRDDVKMTQDHMQPIVKGGEHAIENIVPACMPCNLRKATRGILFMAKTHTL